MPPISAQASQGPRIAVIGAGIAGLSASLALKDHAQVTLFEAEKSLGGHAHTVDMTVAGKTFAVDTGFLVFNHRTYPGITDLFNLLGVETAPSNMGFSVQVRKPAGHFEWAGNSLASVFAQPRNALRPRFWSMLSDLSRFNRLATQRALAQETLPPSAEQSLAQFLDEHRFGSAFRDDYLLPMIACIWSCPEDQMLDFPVRTLLRFCHNHGLLQVRNRPQWHTVRGGSRRYVEAIGAQLTEVRTSSPVQHVWRDKLGVTVESNGQRERFDGVVFCTHPPQTSQMLGEGATREERTLLAAIRYQSNTAVLHTDASVMPRARRAWAAWNFEREGRAGGKVCLHYWLNNLQPLPITTPILVSLNPIRPIAPSEQHGEFHYDHPVFDAGAIAAQRALPELQGQQRSAFAGAWCNYGFHEDGYQAGQSAAAALLKALC